MKRCLLLLFTLLAGAVPAQEDSLTEVVNLRGQVLEKGTGQPVAGALVMATFDNPDTTALSVTWQQYLSQIGSFEIQFLEYDRLVTFAESTAQYAFRSMPPGELV